LNRSGVGVRRRIAAGVEGIRLRSKSACVLELPADVDPERSIAVLSNGLLAIRMPKLNTRHRGKTEVVKA
jgi:HSP20 family molecular chaperone IbpA